MEGSSNGAVDLDWWIRRLDGAPAVLQLPADRPRPNRLGPDVERCTAAWSPALRLGAEALAQRNGAALADVLLAAWQALLVRYGDEHDLVIGHLDGAELHLLRRQLTPEDRFAGVVAETAEAVRESRAAGAVRVSELLAAMGAEPSPGKHPVFQVGFATGTSAGVASAPPMSDAAQPCDLVLRWGPTEAGGIAAQLDFSTALFDPPRAQRMLAHLGVLLHAGVDSPDKSVAALPLLTAEDHADLERWNDTARPHDASRPIAALFAEQVARTPDAVAIEMDDRTLTYRELDRRANRLAVALQARGVEPDATVAISIDRSPEQMVAVLAVLKAGGAYVPVDATYPEARRIHMLESSGARVVLVGEGMSDVVPATVPSEVVELDAPLLAAPTAQDDAPPPCEATGAHLGYVIYTSGSTGQPKGVALSQAALTNLVEWQLRRPGFAPGARTLQFASLSFDVSFQEIFATWCSGGTLVLVGDAVRRDPRSLLDHLVRARVERVFFPFVAVRGLADAAVASQEYPTSLREVYTAGEQLQVDDVLRTFFDALPGCLLENQYGPSESHVVTAEPLAGPPASWPALPSIGGPIANTQIRILDGRGEQTPPGVPGELYIGGICLARGYLGRPDLTAERFVAHPLAGDGRLYRTGDLARWRDDGTVEFLGRADDQVKFRGFRVEPGEIAAVLSGFPQVRQCVAKVVEVDGTGARLAAYVQPAEGATLSLADLHQFARDRLPDYLVPSHVVLMDAFPLTPSGKIDAQSLPAPEFDRRILASAHVAPRTPEEAQLAEVWELLLGITDVGVDDDFFDLGGDSLRAVEMFAIIGDRFGRELPLGALAQDPTIAGLARHLTGDADAQRWDPLVTLSDEGAGVPLFCVHGGSGNVASFPKLARVLPDHPVHALQWDGLDGSGGTRSIAAMAECYLREIRSVQPHGPYHLAGQCVGGLIAREMARTLRGQGEAVAFVIMYDAPNVFSTHHHFASARVPAVPQPLRGLANRLVGTLAELVRWARGRRGRPKAVAVLWLRSALRLPVPAQDRLSQSTLVMLAAVWRHRIRPLDVPTLLVHTGKTRSRDIGLAGVWADGMLGWSEHVGEHFSVHVVPGEHNDILYEPEALRLLTERLPAPSRANARGAARMRAHGDAGAGADVAAADGGAVA